MTAFFIVPVVGCDIQRNIFVQSSSNIAKDFNLVKRIEDYCLPMVDIIGHGLNCL